MPAAAEEPSRRAAEARALLVGPVDELDRHRGRLALVRRAAPRAPRRRRARRPASRRAARRRCASRRRRSCRSRPRASPTGSRRRRARPRRPARLELAEQPFARASASPRSTQAGAPRPGPRSAPPAHAGPRAAAPSRTQASATIKGTAPLGCAQLEAVRGSWSRMVRWRRIIGASPSSYVLLSPGAQARSSPYAQGHARELRPRPARGGLRGTRAELSARRAKMQLRFTLQASTPEDPRGARSTPTGFGTWITAPPGSPSTPTTRPCRTCSRPRTTAPSLNFRWRDARGQDVRTERAISPVCKQPDSRPDLVVRSVRVAGRRATWRSIFNRGREAAGAVRRRLPARRRGARHRRRSPGWRRRRRVTVLLPGPAVRRRASRSRPSPTRARTSTRPTRRTTRSACPAEPPAGLVRRPTLSKNHED